MADRPSRDAIIEYLRSTFQLTPLHKLLGLRMVDTDEPGKVVRLQVFDGRQQALEAVGLSE